MSHYLLSMLILVAASRWTGARTASPRASRATASDRLVALRRVGARRRSARSRSSPARPRRAAGPHAGGAGTGDVIKRLTFKGADTLRYVIEQHARLATLLGVARRRAVGARPPPRRDGAAAQAADVALRACSPRRASSAGVQYELELPAEIVWVHVALAALTWVAILVAVAAARQAAAARRAEPRGRRAPRRRRARARRAATRASASGDAGHDDRQHRQRGDAASRPS